MHENEISEIIIGKCLEIHKKYYKIDFLVEDKVVVELKSVRCFAPVHNAQLLTYLKILNKKLGLLINFNRATLKEGIKRVVNGI